MPKACRVYSLSLSLLYVDGGDAQRSMVLTSGDPSFFHDIARHKNDAAAFDRLERQVSQTERELKAYYYAEQPSDWTIKLLIDVPAPVSGW